MCVSPLAYTNLVAGNEINACRTDVGDKASKGQLVVASTNDSTTSSTQKVKSDYLLTIRRYYERKGLQKDTIDVLMRSWRKSTLAQYNVYLNRFLLFLRNKHTEFSFSLHNGLSFLTQMHTDRCSYNQIAMSRSALSTIIDKGIKPYPSFGQHPFVKRFLKGIFEMKPVLPKYPFVWDVRKLLDYFRKGDKPGDSSFSVLG